MSKNLQDKKVDFTNFSGPCGENASDAACPANQDCTKTDDAFACVCTDGYTAVATTGDESLTCEGNWEN